MKKLLILNLFILFLCVANASAFDKAYDALMQKIYSNDELRQEYEFKKAKRLEIGKKIIDILEKISANRKSGIHLFDLNDFIDFFTEFLDASKNNDYKKYNEEITVIEKARRPNWVLHKLHLLRLSFLEGRDLVQKNPEILNDPNKNELYLLWKDLDEQIKEYEKI